MEGSWMDHIAPAERMKIRKRMRSPEAYEKLRDKVKGPEDLKEEMKKSEALAELHFALESEKPMHDALKSQVEKDMKEQGIDGVIDSSKLSPEARKSLEQGKFTLTVSSHPQTHHDTLTAVPEGNVQEKIPLKQTFNDRYVGQFLKM